MSIRGTFFQPAANSWCRRGRRRRCCLWNPSPWCVTPFQRAAVLLLPRKSFHYQLTLTSVVLCISSLFYSFCFLYVPMKIICTWLLHNHKMLSHSSWRRPRPLSPLVHSGFLTILLCAKYCHQCRWVEVEHSEGGWLGGRMCSFWWLLSSFQLTFARFADRYERAVRKDALCFSLRNVHMWCGHNE